MTQSARNTYPLTTANGLYRISRGPGHRSPRRTYRVEHRTVSAAGGVGPWMLLPAEIPTLARVRTFIAELGGHA